MNARKLMIVAGIAAAVLVLAVALVPMALAQAPINDLIPGYGNGPMMNNGMFGQGGRMQMNNFAAGPMGQRGQGEGPGFVDEDGDGVCDNAGTGGQGQGQGPGFVDEDGDGVCDHAGDGGQGPGFTDEDGDGVCDYAGTDGMRGGQGAGRMGRSQGQMMGRWAQQGE